MIKLVSDYKAALQWSSIRASLLFSAVATGWLAIADSDRAAILTWIGVPPAAVVAVGFLLVAVFRVLLLQWPASDAE
jgi:hypothetical protein